MATKKKPAKRRPKLTVEDLRDALEDVSAMVRVLASQFPKHRVTLDALCEQVELCSIGIAREAFEAKRRRS